MARHLILAVLLLAVALLSLVPQQPARAHSLLLRSDPPMNARLLEAPREVAGWFSEPLAPGVSALRVTDGAGNRVDSGQTEIDPADQTRMSVPLRSDVGPGFYSVAWETLSTVDGHIRFGSFRFTVLNPDRSEPAGPRPVGVAPGAPTGGDEPVRAVVKAIGLIAASVLMGSLTFALFVLPDARRLVSDRSSDAVAFASTRRLLVIALGAVGVLLLTGVTELLLQLGQASGASVLSTPWAGRWFGQQAALLFVVAALWWDWSRDGGQRRGSIRTTSAALAAALVYVLLVSTVSHSAAVRTGSFWATVSDFVHFAAAAVWVGGLLQLSLLFRGVRALAEGERRRLLGTALRRFSLLAASSVVVLLAAGLFNALVHVSDWRSLLDTTYGRLLTAKVLLVLPLLVIAGVNAFVLRPRYLKRAEAGDGRQPLLTSLFLLVRIEAAIAVLVLVLVGALVQFTPSRTEAEAGRNLRATAGAVPFERTMATTAGADVSLVVSPAVVGTNQFRVELAPAVDEPLGEVEGVRLTLHPVLASSREQTLELTAESETTYRASGDWLDEPGRWVARVEVTRAKRSEITAAFAFGVQGIPARADRGPLSYPLTAGNWAMVIGLGLMPVSALVWIWRGQLAATAYRRRAIAIGSMALPVLGLVVFIWSAVSVAPSPPAPFATQLALRYQAADGRFVLWEADPLQVGHNRIRVTVLNGGLQPVRPREIAMSMSRLDRDEPAVTLQLRADADSAAYLAEAELPETGWWSFEVALDDQAVVRFYFRLDDPSPGALAITPPTYESDPAASVFYRHALDRYAALDSLRWREELTGGVLAPTGVGGWVATDGEAVAPDRVHLVINSEGSGRSELYRIGGRMCRRFGEKPWECMGSPNTPAFDPDYQESATAFRLGRGEVIDGEQTRIVFFYNVGQQAWYAWWVGEDTGHLRRQVMVAGGHRMLTEFFDHNAPFTIRPPAGIGF